MSTPATIPTSESDQAVALESPSAKRGTFRRIFRRPSTAIALGFVVLLVLVAIFANVLMPYDPEDLNFAQALQPPSAEHVLGTDELGRDVLSRLIAGTRIALAVSLGSVALAALVGVPFGLVVGFKGGWWDRLGSRGMDMSDALPGLIVAFAIIAAFGRGLFSIVFAISLIFAAGLARMTRAVTLAEREKEYVDAARVSALRSPEILFRQILPNMIGPLTAQASLMLGSAIIIESTLSFLDVGVETASWGGMLASASEEMARYPGMVIPPALAIVLSVLCFNLVANGISDVVAGTSLGVLGRRSRSAARSVSDDPPIEPVIGEDPLRRGGILEVQGVTVELDRPQGDPVRLVDNAWLSLGQAEVVGLLGESGSGKSMLAKSILGLLPRSTRLAAGSVVLNGEELTGRSRNELRRFRGDGIAAVFQNPTAALSPVHTIGKQLTEPLRIHLGLSRSEARSRAAELLDLVGVENAKSRLGSYPHEFSGGMAQRVAIAMALAAEPKVLIADEAASALDVTTQAQVLDLLLELRDSMGMAILMITHDLGVIAETCDRAVVMYAGQIVEVTDVSSLFDRPQHPYTAALLASNPSFDHTKVGSRRVIAGTVPPPTDWPIGCHFAGRCEYARAECSERPIPFVDGVRCVRSNELASEMVER